MEKLDKILRASLAKKGLAKTTESAQICFYVEKWTQMSVAPISFSGGVLKVSAMSSSEASELQMLSEDLVEYLNKKIGRKIVRSLRIVNTN